MCKTEYVTRKKNVWIKITSDEFLNKVHNEY